MSFHQEAEQVVFEYGEESDVLFISLGTGEPSYVEEVDDVLLVERGMSTDQITGFRIMGIKRFLKDCTV